VVLVSGGDDGLGAHGQASLLRSNSSRFMVALSGRAHKRDLLRHVRQSVADG